MIQEQNTAKEAARTVSILSYLGKQGIPYKKKGNLYLCSSPFSNDSNWSFTIYPSSNSFFDFSTRKGGDIISLVMAMEDVDFREAISRLTNSRFEKFVPLPAKYEKKPFSIETYINYDLDEQRQIFKYAKGRGITEGFKFGVFFTKKDSTWLRHPSLLFPHADIASTVVGCKLRDINAVGDDARFYARGKLGFYILENLNSNMFGEPTVYVIESETSANSLWMHFKSIKHNAVVISCGAVSSVPESIPDKYKEYKLKIIIDYDGDEDLYTQRCELYNHLDGEHIRLILPKGEDVNSLWAKGKIKLISNLIV